MSIRLDLTVSLAAALGAMALGGCAREKENVAEVVASGGCPSQQINDSNCSGVTVATADDELRAALDVWGHDLDEIRARVPG